ncbi:MAG: PhoPQ-activated pathogenicity-related family protein [Symbiopectobacterium sp.]|uniref:PhoPQ-activated pathogenicity-related family protein n=1 Tax=Symbiopectobacterium sp. TaxID=2952789 RepID=UPI0039E8A023
METACHDDKDIDFTHVVSCYREDLAALPMNYHYDGDEVQSDVRVKKYQMVSQSWSPGGLVQPTQWQHHVDIYFPARPVKSQHALIVVNNETNYSNGVIKADQRNEFSPEMLVSIARATKTIVISVSNIPNQYLTYSADSKPLKEDDSVARSWSLFMENPALRTRASVHIPMATAVSQAIRLAKQELKAQNITRFIVTGASKRGWSSWLTFISDPDVDAVVPFVIDLLDTRVALTHMYRSYGGNWPIVFYPYYQQGIDKAIDTPAFQELMKIEDPMQYLAAGQITQLNKTKYIVNASGDDFYATDNARFYYDALPGEKSLRVVPNTNHNGILKHVERTLITFVNRFLKNKPLPQITVKLKDDALSVSFSEKPITVRRWTAKNPEARDFRYACNIQYQGTKVTLPNHGPVSLALNPEHSGWQATFVEATFKDGFVATSRVYVTPDDAFPTTAPPVNGNFCKTLPGRGLGEMTP